MTEREIDGVPYLVRNTARKMRISMRIDEQGSLVVSKSPWISVRSLEEVLRKNLGWIRDKLQQQSAKPKKILGHCSVRDFLAQKEITRKLVDTRLRYFNEFYNFKIGKVYIRNQKSRWGSCSGRGNLSFNYKLALVPPELADYVIVHELCHLSEMNHGPKFWQLVGETVPDYKARRRELKKY